MSKQHHLGQRLSISNSLCTVRYIGSVEGTSGLWLGVEWDNPDLGKHNGTHSGAVYFTCRSPSAICASFIRPTRPVDPAQSFLSALREKYVAEASPFTPAPRKQIYFNGKLAEEVGFEKVAAQQAMLGELRVVVLDGARIRGTSHGKYEAYNGVSKEAVDEIQRTCPNIVELGLSRNLIETWDEVVEIVLGLRKVKKLVLSGNRFREEVSAVGPSARRDAQEVFEHIVELALDATLLTWLEISTILQHFPSLKILSLQSNNLSPPVQPLPAQHLTSINLSFNPLLCLSSISSFNTLPHLNSLNLRDCEISSLPPLPSPFPRLQHLDLSSNLIPSLSELNTLPSSFPSLTSLRCSSNPFYTSLPVEEAHMLSVARIPNLTMLNYSRITEKERDNAELYYLSKIRAELGQLSPPELKGDLVTENDIQKYHPLFTFLSKKHNQDEEFERLAREARDAAQLRDEEGRLINPNSLGARLVDITCYLSVPSPDIDSSAPDHREDSKKKKTTATITISKSTSVYRLKSLIGRELGILPLLFRMIWETGELDPVGRNIGNPGRVGEGDRIAEAESDEDEDDDDDLGDQDKSFVEGVKWVKREIEIVDGTRPIGFWFEGRKVRMRIEAVGKEVIDALTSQQQTLAMQN